MSKNTEGFSIEAKLDVSESGVVTGHFICNPGNVTIPITSELTVSPTFKELGKDHTERAKMRV